MNTYAEIQASDLAELDLHLVAAALKALQELTWATDDEIYTDAPECQVSVNRVQDAIELAYSVLMQIQQTLTSAGEETNKDRANRILDEAEEAFAARSLAEERALEGKYPRPVLVQDYLFWIEAETRLQEGRLPALRDEQTEYHYYLEALRDLAQELRRLGFTPNLALRQLQAEKGGSER